MKRASGKSHCPINYTLEILGDQWSLLILRDMLHFGKQRYKDFLDSDERISTNILADRLSKLTDQGIIEKKGDAYLPTQKGYDLLPLLTEISLWGIRYDPKTNATEELIRKVNNKPEQFREEMQEMFGQAKQASAMD